LESKFKQGDVFYVATGEYLSSENDLKTAVKDWSDHELLQHSTEFLEKNNRTIQAFHDGKLNFLPYATLMKDINELRGHLPHDVVTMRTFSLDMKDDIGMMHKVTFQGKIEIVELPAPTLLEGYETHCKEGFGNDELTVLTIKRHIAFRQISSPSPYSNQQEYEAWLKTKNLKNDSKTVSEFVDAIAKAAESFAGKFVTDEGQNLRADVLSDLSDIKPEWTKKVAVPFTTPKGLILPEQTADTRLLSELQDLTNEAYKVAQTMESKKGISFFEQLKGLFKRNEAVLLLPEDAKAI
jgi:hypothetical protein